MPTPRSRITDFAYYNPKYINATVAFYTVDENGDRTETLAPLYAGTTGSAQVENPQRLGSRGKFQNPVYHEVDIVGVVESFGEPTHTTGVIGFPASPADNSITEAKIVDGAVTTAKIADDAVTADKIADGAVTFTQSGTGPVLRTQQARSRDTIHLFDFIAVADHAGIIARTDDNDHVAEIQNAVDELISQGSGKLFVPRGLYHMAGDDDSDGRQVNIDLDPLGDDPRTIEIIGEGREATIFQSDIMGSSDIPMFRIRGGVPQANSFRMAHMRLQSDPDASPPGSGNMNGGRGIQLEDSVGSYFDDIRLDRLRRGIFFYNKGSGRYTELCQITRLYSTACYEAIVFDVNDGVGQSSFNQTKIQAALDLYDNQRGLVVRQGNLYASDIKLKTWTRDTSYPIMLADKGAAYAALINEVSIDWDNETISGTPVVSITGTNSYVRGEGRTRFVGTAPTIPGGNAVDGLPLFDTAKRIPGVDARSNLGGASNRFKDLYLSGGVYVGGTGAANYLNDCEKGTFTPVVADALSGGNVATVGTATGTYRKIGDQVTATIELTNIDTTGMTSGNVLYIRGLPFQAAANDGFTATARLDGITFSGFVVAQVASGNTAVQMFSVSSGSADAVLTVAAVAGSTSDIYITATYFV